MTSLVLIISLTNQAMEQQHGNFSSAKLLTSLTQEDLDQRLIKAVSKKDVTAVKLYLEKGANPDSLMFIADNETIMCPLHMATSQGSTKIVSLLLAHGAQIERQASLGFQAIH